MSDKTMSAQATTLDNTSLSDKTPFVRVTFASLRSRFRDGIRRFGPAHLCALAIVVVTLVGHEVSNAEDFSINLTLGLYWGALAGVFVQLLAEAKAWRRLRLAIKPATPAKEEKKENQSP